MRRRCAILLLALLIAVPAARPRDMHYSFWSDDPRPFLAAIRDSAQQPRSMLPEGQRVCGGILTHHFLASGMMVRFFAELRVNSSPETIVLLAPNHFHQGLADISTTSLPWKTPFGVIETKREWVRALGAALQLPEDPGAFSGEHSVGVLMPFLKYYFPRSRVVPILIDVNARPYDLRRLRDWLSTRLDNPKTLLLLSMDFSHDSVSAVSEARDREAERVIAALDAAGADGLHVDCRKGLRLLLETMEETGCEGVRFSEHTNSARLTGNPEQPNVTSYFAIYFVTRAGQQEVRKR